MGMNNKERKALVRQYSWTRCRPDQVPESPYRIRYTDEIIAEACIENVLKYLEKQGYSIIKSKKDGER